MYRPACLAVLFLALAAGLAQAQSDAKGTTGIADRFAGRFDAIKIAGAPRDGVAVGDSLCYRSLYGNQPTLMVFARPNSNHEDSLSFLVEQLDEAVKSHKGEHLKAYVSVLSEDPKTAKAVAAMIGAKSETVPVVFPLDHSNGPKNYAINPKAAITIVMTKDGKVVGRQVLTDRLNESAARIAVQKAAERLVEP